MALVKSVPHEALIVQSHSLSKARRITSPHGHPKLVKYKEEKTSHGVAVICLYQTFFFYLDTKKFFICELLTEPEKTDNCNFRILEFADKISENQIDLEYQNRKDKGSVAIGTHHENEKRTKQLLQNLQRDSLVEKEVPVLCNVRIHRLGL